MTINELNQKKKKKGHDHSVHYHGTTGTGRVWTKVCVTTESDQATINKQLFFVIDYYTS